MTWAADGVDAVLGAAGGVWHLSLTCDKADLSSAGGVGGADARREADEGGERGHEAGEAMPTLARVWPGGHVKV